MVKESPSWFIAERSEAMASILLRSRKDIQVRDELRGDNGADFLVDVSQGDSPWRMLFVVQVKGTTSDDYEAWFQGAKQIFKPSKSSPLMLPTCLFLINVLDRRGLYAWIAEPLVASDSASLQFNEARVYHELDESALDQIVNRVRQWYKVVPNQLLPEGQGARKA